MIPAPFRVAPRGHPGSDLSTSALVAGQLAEPVRWPAKSLATSHCSAEFVVVPDRRGPARQTMPW